MMIMFKRLHFLRVATGSFLFVLRRYPSLVCAGFPAALILTIFLYCRETIVRSLNVNFGDLSYGPLLGLVFLNLVEIVCLSQLFVVWSRLADYRFDKIPVSVLVGGAFRNFWRMALPILPLWILLPTLFNVLLTLFLSTYRIFSLSGPQAAAAATVWLALTLWPVLTVLAAKIAFVPVFAVEAPRPSFFTSLIASWNYVTIRILRHHWLSFSLLTLPGILGLFLPMTLMQENLLFMVKGPASLYVQMAGVLLLWLVGPLAVAAVQRLNMVIVSEFNSEIQRLSASSAPPSTP